MFDAIVALVLIPLGSWLLFRGGEVRTPGRWANVSEPWLVVAAVLVGCVGGIYGIGGGSILAPLLISFGRSPREVAPATLAATFVTSVAGIATFLVLATQHHGSIAPDWGVGIALGVGGLIGGYTGARLQPHMPEAFIRRLLGLLVLAIGIRYGLRAFT